MKSKQYKIGGKVYYQRKVVLGQISQLLEIVEDFQSIASPNEFIAKLGTKLATVIAIVLIPADDDTNNPIRLQDKNMNSIKTDIENSLDMDKALEIVEDFFAINNINALIKRLGMAMDNVTTTIKKAQSI